jgi:amino acid transporter
MSKNTNDVTLNADRLQGNMGVGTLVMSVLAFSGPLLTTSGFIPVYFPLLGEEAAGVPMVFIFVTVMLVLFAIGFSKMGTVMARPGGFYTYVTEGLGRKNGLMTAFLLIVGYLSIALFAPPLIAIYAQNVIENIFNGPHIHWFIIAIISVLGTTLLAYRRIDISAKVLFWVMVFESAAVFIFDAVCFVNGYELNGGLVTFTVPSIATSGFGIVLLFAVGNFMGFEATVIYREECKNPQKTIPRATMIAVIGIGSFYFLASWAFLAYYGANSAEVLTNDAAIAFMNILGTFSKVFGDVVSVVVITSCFASLLSIQNVASRYLFSLGSDKVLPKVLGKVHKKHHSPHVAATTVGVIWVITLTIFLLTGKDPVYLYLLFAGVGEFLIVFGIFMACLAVIFYFQKNKQYNFSAWSSFIAPGIALVGLAFVLVKAVMNFSALTGASSTVNAILFIAMIVIGICGFVYAFYLEKKKPEIYDCIGRQDFTE